MSERIRVEATGDRHQNAAAAEAECIHSALRLADQHASILVRRKAARDATRNAGSVGHPVFHVELRIIDPETLSGPIERWRDVAVGGIGEIAVRGPITLLGYWNLPEATAETLRGHWVRTGDLASGKIQKRRLPEINSR